MLSVNKKKLLRILFQTVCLFLPWLATTSSTMLNRSGESRHSCLVSELGESIQSFNIKNGASCRIFIDVLYQDEKVPFQSWFAEGFFSSFFKIENGCWILSTKAASIDFLQANKPIARKIVSLSGLKKKKMIFSYLYKCLLSVVEDIGISHQLFFLINLFILFIYFWLRWGFVAVHWLSLVAVSGGYSWLVRRLLIEVASLCCRARL